MHAKDSKWRQHARRVVNFVKLPQERHPMLGIVRDEQRSIQRDELNNRGEPDSEWAQRPMKPLDSGTDSQRTDERRVGSCC